MSQNTAQTMDLATVLQLNDPDLLRQTAYINGEFLDIAGHDVIAVNNPATGDIIGTVPNLGATETKRAIDAAHLAFGIWRKLLAKERSEILKRWADLQLEHIDDLSKILTAEQGKPLAQSRSEILGGIDYVVWMAEECRRVYGDLIPTHNEHHRLLTYKQPVGVCAMITPWNFPSSMITRKAAPALASGCTVVLKPSEMTPFSALALAELADRAGIPKGVFNIITGDAKAIGGEMTSNPIVRKIGFTGSTPVGKLLYKQSADTVKKISLELGGNAPFIVFDDADLDKAVPAAIISKYRNSGQTCVCANRIFVQSGVYDAFVDKFTKAVKELKIGNGLDDGIDIGPLIDERAVEKVETLLKDAVSKGGDIKTGGKRHDTGACFFEPTVIAHATKDMDFFEQEIFGPLAPIFKFDTEEEVVELANESVYGLAAYFYAKDVSRIWRVSENLEYGMVGVNSVSIVSAQSPFGGWKQSGMGHEGSKYGMDDYLEIKLVSVGDV